jgi:UDP-GlcNAc:undecaprenyl-phosphate GlcNAc-1-phosphate transferase
MTFNLLAVGVTGIVTALVATPLVRAGALATGLVDHPDPTRKLHARQTPLGGGLAVLLGALVAAVLGLFLSGQLFTLSPADARSLWGLLAASGVICVLGIVDDAQGMRGRQKLLGQIVAVGIVVVSGLSIQNISVLGWNLDLGPLAIPFTFFWLLGAINALNLIDGADGLATTIGLIASISISAMAVACERPTDALIAAALAAGLAGFLPYNFPPAKIFLGDAGSMLIGLVLGVLAIRCALKGPATVALAAPAAIMAIPIFDSAAAIIRRTFTGRSIYCTDRGHLHHMMFRRGFSARGMLLGVALLCVITASGALASVYVNNEWIALMSGIGVIGMLVATRVFGFAEFVLVSNRLWRLGGSLLPKHGGGHDVVRQEMVRLQGSRNWDELWNALTDFAETHTLHRLRLEMNMAWLHEGFHATWERPTQVEPRDLWSIRLPLVAKGRTLGRLDVVGPVTQAPVYELVSLFAELLESLEPCLARLCSELPPEDDTPSGRKPERAALPEPQAIEAEEFAGAAIEANS